MAVAWTPYFAVPSADEADLGLFLAKERGQAVHLAGTLSADSWQGSRRIQFRVIDAAKAF